MSPWIWFGSAAALAAGAGVVAVCLARPLGAVLQVLLD